MPRIRENAVVTNREIYHIWLRLTSNGGLKKCNYVIKVLLCCKIILTISMGGGFCETETVVALTQVGGV